jgi:hypothetical protein
MQRDSKNTRLRPAYHQTYWARARGPPAPINLAEEQFVVWIVFVVKRRAGLRMTARRIWPPHAA